MVLELQAERFDFGDKVGDGDEAGRDLCDVEGAAAIVRMDST